MRIYKLNTSLLALLFALIALAATVGIGCFVLAHSAVGRGFDIFYAPTEFFQDLCLPNFKKGEKISGIYALCFYFFALIQWYLIFLVGIGIYRNLFKK